MKRAIAIFALCFVLANAVNFKHVDELLTNGYNEIRHHFFGRHFIKDLEEGSHRVVHFAEGGMFSTIEHLQEYNDRFADAIKNPEKYKLKDEHILQCKPSGKPEFYKFLADFKGYLKEDGQSITFDGNCFKENTVTLKVIDESNVEVIHVMKNKKSLTCSEGYLYSSLANYHMEGFYEGGTHTVTFKGLTKDDMASITESGLMIFHGCDSVLNFYPDILKTTFLFTGGLGLDPNIPFWGSKVTPEQVKENVRFTKEAMGFEYKKRPEKAREGVYEIDESLINSGDFFLNVRMDGLNQMTQYGSGTHAGHSVMALRVDGELYIVESNAAWYWPREGLQINPFKDWIKWAHNADYHTVWLPLRKEYSQMFNESKAYEFFKSVEGMPYGYHNFLFGWIDTPDHSYPPMLDPLALAPVFAIIEKLSPAVAQKMFNLAINKRLGTQNLTIPQLAVEAEKQGKTFPELYAMVEEDGWWYPDGYSYVCSSFVIGMWKAAGLFDGFEVNAVEFTPRDVYQATFIDPNPPVPEDCKKLDPENHFCQIMGRYRMEFPGISTVEPYSHMNEKCQSEAPDYLRIPENC